jgi:hypothetical protein
MQTTPEIGQLVIARKRPFVVTDISPAAVGIGNYALRRHQHQQGQAH